MDEIIEGLLDEFAEKVAAAVAERAGSEAKIIGIDIGKYSFGAGVRVEHENGFSVDLCYSHLYNGDTPDNEGDEDDSEEWEWSLSELQS